MRARGRVGIIAAWLSTWATLAPAEQPLSAIDWLSDVTTAPLASPPKEPSPLVQEDAVTRGVVSETIQVSPLDGPNTDAVGLLPRSMSGLPAALWQSSTGETLSRLMGRIETGDLLPATRDLLFTLLLTELDAPFGSDRSGAFLTTRVETLIRLGALEQARAMLERAGIETEAQFAQWFDLSLFLGAEAEACAHLIERPALSRDFATRIFCLARSGDWAAAAVSFESARVLGQFSAEEETLLLRFLNVDLDETATPLPVPFRPSPLTFTLYEAVGEALPTMLLALPFAYGDLRANSGWKAQLEAAERLAAAGALPANRLLGLYTERRPAASGGVWDRAAAVQAFDAALGSGDRTAIGAALRPAWDAMQSVGLEHAFASLYGERLRLFPMQPSASALAFRLSLLTEDYEAAALSHTAKTAMEHVLVGLATGQATERPAPDARVAAILDAFKADAPPERFRRDIDRRAIGAVLLRAIDLFGDGRRGDLGKVTEALALFRALGLESVARRAALELLILDPRG